MSRYQEALNKALEAKERRRKRRAKARTLWGAVSRGRVRAQLWSAFSMYVKIRDKRLWNGLCRICGRNPIEVTYHIVPQQRGDATRYDPENCVGSCAGCNFGERWNRSLYREKHIAIFGKELVERLEEKARQTVQYSTAELVELRDKYREVTIS